MAYFNDPGIAQGFANLERAFRPPSARDLYAAAEAQATNDKNARLQQLFMRAQDPATTHEMLDRLGIGAGSFNPNQSYYGVDQGNQVLMRGQDTVANTALRTNAATNATSRLNNADDIAGRGATDAADNVRALEQTDRINSTSRLNNADDITGRAGTNAADNARALQQTALDNQNKLVVNAVQPLNAGQTMDPIAAVVAGLPAAAQVPRRGNINLSQGESVITPGGERFTGIAPNKTIENVEAEAAAPSVMAAAADPANADPVARRAIQIISPQAASPVGKLITDKQALVPGSADAAAIDNAIKKEGESGTGVAPLLNYTYVDPVTNRQVTTTARNTSDGIVDSQTGAKLPGGGQITSRVVQDTVAGFEKSNEAQDNKALVSGAVQNSLNQITAAYDRPDKAGMPTAGDIVAFSAVRMLPPSAQPAAQMIANSKMTPQGQLFFDNLLNVIPYKNFVVSGQGVNESEYTRSLLKSIPYPNDTADVLANKKQQLNDLFNAVWKLSGPAAGRVSATTNPAAPDGLPATSAHPTGATIGAGKEPPIPAPAGSVPGDTGAGKSAVTPPAAAPNSSTPAPAPHADGVTGTYKGHKVKIVNGVPVDAVTGQPVE